MSYALNVHQRQAAGPGLPDRRAVDRRIAAFDASRHRVLERRIAGERRRNAFHDWRKIRLGGLPVVVVDRETSAKDMVAEAMKRHGLWRYPAYITSTNGEVTHRCAVSATERALFLQADAIHADGMPHVFASRITCDVALPERVATTDLFHHVAREAEARGATMFMLGASEASNAAAAERVQAEFQNLRLIGRRNGYFESTADEIDACAQIAALGPDILWVSMGVPREQAFIARHRHRLTSVGLIKTSGGLFDFLSGSKPRAPDWMQRAGLEWLWRVAMEPRRLAWRYLKTNPHAMYLLLTRSG